MILPHPSSPIMGFLLVFMGSVLLLLAHAECAVEWPDDGNSWPASGNSGVMRPENSYGIRALQGLISPPLEETKRHQRQIRFKSSYQELPEGLKPTSGEGAGRGPEEELSYFVQVDVEDPPASTALARLPKGARTYFPPQPSRPGASLPKEQEDSDDGTVTRKALLVGRSSGRSRAFHQGAAEAFGEAYLERSKTDFSPRVEGLTFDGFGLKAIDDNALVTSLSTPALRTYLHSEASPSTTENPNVISKGVSESSSYTSYSQTSKNPSAQKDHKASSAFAFSSAPSSVGTFSSPTTSSSSPSYSPPRSHSATPSSSKSISISSLTSLESTPSTSHSFSSSSNAASTTLKSPSISSASNSVSGYSSLASSHSKLSRKPSNHHSYSSYSITTQPPVTSTAKKVTTPSVSSEPGFFITSIGPSVIKPFSHNSFIAVPLESSTVKSFTASPSRSRSHSFHAFPNPPSSSSRSRSVINNFKPSSRTSKSFSPTLSGKHSRIHLTKRPSSLNIHSRASSASSKIPISSQPFHRSQKTFSQGTRPSTSTVLPKRSSTVDNKAAYVAKPLQTLSPPHLPGRSPAPRETLTNSYTFTSQSSRANQSFGNVFIQPEPKPKAKSLSSNPADSFQDITVSRRGDGGGSDGKTPTVGSSDVGSIPGRSGVDYPTLLTIPKTGFDCSAKASGGYYADVEADCQVFHVCWPGGSAAFLCPVGTLFSQRLLVCDWWYNVDCSATHAFLR